MKLLTGNDLVSGAVIWWTGSGWSRHIADAADVGEHGPAILASEEAARRVNSAYLIAATHDGGAPRPAHIKDRVRATGPTVRPDLALAAPDPDAGDWII